MQLSIIIPARNEEKVILKTIQDIERKVKIPHNITVVDDSNDGTTELVRDYSKKNRNIRIIKGNPKKKSFGNALKRGLTNTRKGVVVVVMADLCDDPATINLMYRKIQEGWDAVCGSRYMKGGRKIGGPKLQGFLSALVCKSLHLITGIPTVDVSNAFKMYRKEVLKDVVFNPVSGVEASMETLFQVYFNGGKITEIPTKWRGRNVGTSKFKPFQRAPRYLKIYSWAVENSLRKAFHLKLKPFYIK